MTVWMRLGRLIPRNREGKWPLAVQLLVFVLFEALFIYGKYQASYQAYDPALSNWAIDVFGVEHFDKVLTLLSMLITAEVCAWHIGLQRYITFGGHTPRRWTILPVMLGNFALSIVTWLLSEQLMRLELPLPTENMMVYTVIHSMLYVAIVVVFCALVHAFRFGKKSHAGWLAAADGILVLLLTLCIACSGQMQQDMLEEACADPAAQQVTVTTIGVPEGVGEESNALLDALLAHSGLNAEDVVIVPAGDMLSSMQAATDPFAAYEEAMKPSNLVGDILMWVQLLPIFFAMKRWLFPFDDASSAQKADMSPSSC
ncbi:MAG: hypothetical protein E7318_02595 [Clostridiales bacterium]|nr:hypothetical protein [Clostridiales bacterium]